MEQEASDRPPQWVPPLSLREEEPERRTHAEKGDVEHGELVGVLGEVQDEAADTALPIENDKKDKYKDYAK
jgi:hypothetical protein